MSLLDKLWDDTVAGPRPDSGLGKLRKYSTFSPRSNSGKESEVSTPRSFTEEASEDAVKVTRSIMIVKPSGSQNRDSPPVSPAGTTPPVSPFAGKLPLSLIGFRSDSFLLPVFPPSPSAAASPDGTICLILNRKYPPGKEEKSRDLEESCSAGKEAFRFRRRSASFAYENASGVGPRSPPPPYDM